MRSFWKRFARPGDVSMNFLNSLHREYSPATELSKLYLYCIRRLAACEAKADRNGAAGYPEGNSTAL